MESISHNKRKREAPPAVVKTSSTRAAVFFLSVKMGAIVGQFPA